MPNKRVTASYLLCLAPLLLVSAGPLRAAEGSCVAPKVAVPDSTIDQFKANPAELLTPGTQGIGATSSRIRNAVASAPSLLPALAPAMKTAAGDEAVALGTGLGAAAQVCAQKSPAAAQAIQQSVADAKNPDLSRAFAAVIGDLPVLAVAAANEAAVPGSTTPGGGGARRDTSSPTFAFRSGTLDEPRVNLQTVGGGDQSSSPGSLVQTFTAPASVSSTPSSGSSTSTVNPALLSVSGSR